MSGYGSSIIGNVLRVYLDPRQQILAIDHIQIVEVSKIVREDGSHVSGGLKYDRVLYPAHSQSNNIIKQIRIYGDYQTLSNDGFTGTWKPSGALNDIQIDFAKLGKIGDTI